MAIPPWARLQALGGLPGRHPSCRPGSPVAAGGGCPSPHSNRCRGRLAAETRWREPTRNYQHADRGRAQGLRGPRHDCGWVFG